jgi:hypothetical protein
MYCDEHTSACMSISVDVYMSVYVCFSVRLYGCAASLTDAEVSPGEFMIYKALRIHDLQGVCEFMIYKAFANS